MKSKELTWDVQLSVLTGFHFLYYRRTALDHSTAAGLPTHWAQVSSPVAPSALPAPGSMGSPAEARRLEPGIRAPARGIRAPSKGLVNKRMIFFRIRDGLRILDRTCSRAYHGYSKQHKTAR